MSSLEKRLEVRGMLREPTIIEIFRHRRADAEFLGFLTEPGEREEHTFYRFKCTVHGYVEAWRMGPEGELLCPHCGQ